MQTTTRTWRTIAIFFVLFLPHRGSSRPISVYMGADGNYKDIDTGDSYSPEEMALKYQGRSEELADMLEKSWDETGHDGKQRAPSLRTLAEAFIEASRFEDGLDLARAALDAAPRRNWEYILTVASAYRHLGQLDLALQYAREAKEVYEQRGGLVSNKDHSPPREELKVILTKLTVTQDSDSHYSSMEASKLTDELNALRHQATDNDGGGGDDDDSLDDQQLVNEVTILEAQGKMAEAREKAALLLRRSESKGKNERTVAIHMYAKTIMREEPEQAVPLFREALRLRTELEGEHSERTANEMQHLVRGGVSQAGSQAVRQTDGQRIFLF